METNPYETGLMQLDRHLKRGYPPGTVVTLVGSPTSSSELIAEEFALVDDHHTAYVTTEPEPLVSPRIRDEADGESHTVHLYEDLDEGLPSLLEDEEEAAEDPAGDEATDETSDEDAGGITAPTSTSPIASDGGQGETTRQSVIVHTANGFADAVDDLRGELAALRERVEAQGAVCLFELRATLGSYSEPEQEILSASDGVLYYDHDPEADDQDYLTVSKYRGIDLGKTRHRLEFSHGSIEISADREA